MKKILDRITYLLAYVSSYFVKFLSPKLRMRFGKMLGRIFMFLFPGRVEIALDNLEKAFPEKEQWQLKKVAAEAFENLGITLMDILAMKHLPEKKIKSLVKIENSELFYRLHAKSKGMIMLGAHYGNWELGAMSVALQTGVNYLIIVEHQANDFINEEINNLRTRFGNRVVSRYRAAREIIKTLQQGEVLALIADQSAYANDLFVDFFGRPAATFDAPAALCLKFDIPMIFGVTVRQADGTYVIKLEEIKHDDLQNDKEGVLELTRRHVKKLEEMIRKHPGHWAWMHRRWKHTPPTGTKNG